MAVEVSFVAKHAVLPIHCRSCTGIARLQISDPVPRWIKHPWTCPACGAVNVLRACWKFAKLLPG